MKNDQPLKIVKKKQTKRRCHIILTESEFFKLTELSQSLGMNKSKIVRLMVLENSNIMLCNTVELIKTLDFLGTQLAQIRDKLEPSIPDYFSCQEQNNRGMLISSIAEYFHIISNIETSFRELLLLTKKMK